MGGGQNIINKIVSQDLVNICIWTDWGYLSLGPTGVCSEDEISVTVVAVGGTTAGVIKHKLTGV